MVIALRRPAFLARLRSLIIRSNSAAGAVCAEFIAIINAAMS